MYVCVCVCVCVSQPRDFIRPIANCLLPHAVFIQLVGRFSHVPRSSAFVTVTKDAERARETNSRVINSHIAADYGRTFRYLRKIIPTYLPRVAKRYNALWFAALYRANECHATRYLFVKNTAGGEHAAAC